MLEFIFEHINKFPRRLHHRQRVPRLLLGGGELGDKPVNPVYALFLLGRGKVGNVYQYLKPFSSHHFVVPFCVSAASAASSFSRMYGSFRLPSASFSHITASRPG